MLFFLCAGSVPPAVGYLEGRGSQSQATGCALSFFMRLEVMRRSVLLNKVAKERVDGQCMDYLLPRNLTVAPSTKYRIQDISVNTNTR